MNKKEFYNKFEKYLQNKDMNNNNYDLVNKMRNYFTNYKNTKKGGENYKLVIIGKMGVFKKFKKLLKTEVRNVSNSRLSKFY